MFSILEPKVRIEFFYRSGAFHGTAYVKPSQLQWDSEEDAKGRTRVFVSMRYGDADYFADQAAYYEELKQVTDKNQGAL